MTYPKSVLQKAILLFLLGISACNSSSENENEKSRGEGIPAGIPQENLPGPYDALNAALRQETRTIEGSVWMVKNLDVDTFRNGDPILQARTAEEWAEAGKNEQPAWCYFRNDSGLGKWFGKLYNGFAVLDPRGLAPPGFHISTESEWDSMMNSAVDKRNVGTHLKAQYAWLPTSVPEGTNLKGFNGLPGGWRDREGRFQTGETRKKQREILDFMGGWWAICGPASGYNNPNCHRLWAEESGVEVSNVDKESGFSVRCVANSTGDSSAVNP